MRITFDITVVRSFPAFISRINEDGASFKDNTSSEAGSRRYRFDREGCCRVCYQIRHGDACFFALKVLDKEERVAIRDAQKREVDIRMADLQAEDKKRADSHGREG